MMDKKHESLDEDRDYQFFLNNTKIQSLQWLQVAEINDTIL